MVTEAAGFATAGADGGTSVVKCNFAGIVTGGRSHNMPRKPNGNKSAYEFANRCTVN
jgi:hypothetical protein